MRYYRNIVLDIISHFNKNLNFEVLCTLFETRQSCPQMNFYHHWCTVWKFLKKPVLVFNNFCEYYLLHWIPNYWWILYVNDYTYANFPCHNVPSMVCIDKWRYRHSVSLRINNICWNLLPYIIIEMHEIWIINKGYLVYLWYFISTRYLCHVRVLL